MPAVVTGQHLGLLFEGRVADQELEHEPVELGLGQRIGALLLDRVLRGDHHEGVGQRPRGALGGHLPFLHRLQQRRLRLGRRAVDLVGQEEVGEDRALAEPEGTPVAVGVEHQLAGDVGRHQVRRELHPLEVEVERLRQGLDQQGLGHARHALQQDVAAHQQRGDQAGQRALLADHDLADLVAQREHRVARVTGGWRAIGYRHARTSWRMVSRVRTSATSSSALATGVAASP